SPGARPAGAAGGPGTRPPPAGPPPRAPRRPRRPPRGRPAPPAAPPAQARAAPDQPGGRHPDVASSPGDAGQEGDGGQAGDEGVVLRGPVRGRALVGELALGALDAGVELRTRARVTTLLIKDDTVVGAEVDGERIDGRVVLATGGFQHDATLVAHYLPGAALAPMGTPGCRGDGLRMAQRAGAVLGNMGEGWWMPAMRVPGERFSGAPY